MTLSEKQLDRTQILRGLDPQKIFSVRFVKKNGQSRKMTCRLKVLSHLSDESGQGCFKKQAIDEEHGLLTVFSMADQDYRSIRVASIRRITQDGVTYYNREGNLKAEV